MATLAVTNDFSAGAAIVASEMNTNFTDIETFINSTPGVLQLTGGTVTGAVTLSNTLTVGVDDTGYDVKLFGATAGSYTLWDESEDELRLIDSLLVVGNTTDAVDMGLVGGVATIRGINVGASAYNDLSIRSASGTQLYLDTAGLVGIGRTPTDSMKLDIETTNAATYARLRITDTYSSYSPAAWYIEGGSNTFAGVFMGDSGDVDIGSMLYYNTDNSLRFVVNTAEALRLDSSGNTTVYGQLDVGGVVTTTAYTPRISTSPTVGGFAGFMTAPTGDGTYGCIFENAAGASVGTIYSDASATAFNTSSDYRLKENVVPTSAAMQRVNALKPVQFNFIIEPDRTLDGFLAHEVAEVVPQAVTGEKDGMRTIPAVEAVEAVEGADATYDDDGNELTPAVLAVAAVEAVAEREVILAQGLDQAKIVPLLTAAIQELDARLAAVEAA